VNLLGRYLSAEIVFVHLGHGLLFWVVIAVLAFQLPWWGALALAPLALASVAGWAYEGIIVWPVVTRLWRGGVDGSQKTETKTTDPSSLRTNHRGEPHD
jgi:hypothetical protein